MKQPVIIAQRANDCVALRGQHGTKMFVISCDGGDPADWIREFQAWAKELNIKVVDA